MGVAHQSISSLGFGTRTNSTVTAPAGIVDGDILVYILVVTATSFITTTPPSGFALVNGHTTFVADVDPADAGTGELQLYVWWKRASGEAGDYTATHASADTEGCVIRYDGALAAGDPTTDPNATTNQGFGNGGSGMIALGGTPATDGNIVIYIGSSWEDIPTSGPPSGTTPTFTERLEAATNVLYVADGPLSPAQATGNKSITGAATNGWAASLVFIQAAVAAAGARWPNPARRPRPFAPGLAR